MKTILVMDDEQDVREVLRIALTNQRPYKVVEAVDGMDGIEKMRAQKPDLVICDIKMPRLNGYQFLIRVAKEESLRSIPVFVITSLTNDSGRDDTDWCASLGVAAFSSKPFQPLDIVRKVDELLGLEPAVS